MTNKSEYRKKLVEAYKTKRRLEDSDLNRRKHWGTKSKMKEYEEAVTSNIDLSPLEETLEQFEQENVTVSENLFDNISSQIDFEDLFKAEMIQQLQGIVSEVFERGSSRVLTSEGDSLKVDLGSEPRRLVNQLEAQEVYLENLAEDAESKVKDIITKGAEEGKSIGDMKNEILDGVEDMTEHRAETIARSELVEASNEGTRVAMEEAGVEKVMISASIDNQTCEEGTFSVTINGETYTSCREWDGEVFDRRYAPKIPRESHPNCRDALIAVVD